MCHKNPTTKREKPQVLVHWESGEITFEPITEICKSRADPYLVAEYALDHGLLDEWHKKCPGLKLKELGKNAKKLFRRVHQAKLRSMKHAPIYMYGHQVPRTHNEAVALDKANGNTKWQDAEALEKKQLWDYNTFEDRGHKSEAKIPEGYKKI